MRDIVNTISDAQNIPKKAPVLYRSFFRLVKAKILEKL